MYIYIYVFQPPTMIVSQLEYHSFVAKIQHQFALQNSLGSNLSFCYSLWSSDYPSIIPFFPSY